MSDKTMSAAPLLQPTEIKRRPHTKARRAQDLIEPVRDMIPTQWRNTRDTDVVSRYIGATRPSTQDGVLDDHEDRLELIERKLGLRLGLRIVSREGRAA